mgnify:CR=1 FL=1
MQKSIFKFLFVASFIIAAGYNASSLRQDAEMSDLALANVEALARNENGLMISCDGSSVVVICKRTCWSCYREYIAVNGYGKSTGFKGRCECGAMY